MASMFKMVGEQIVFTGTLMEAYIPTAYYDMGIATEYGGERVEVLGLFNARFFSDEDGKKPIGELATINIPTTINVYPSTTENRTIQLIKDVDEDTYKVLKFYNGSTFTDKYIIKKAKNAEAFLKVLESGKIPRTIPYEKIIEIWTTNMQMNDVTMPDVPMSNREMIVAEIYRDRKNPAYRYGIRAGKNPGISSYDYIPANSRTLTKYSSTFAGLTFEDFDTMVTNGLNISKSGRKQAQSPIEEIIKY